MPINAGGILILLLFYVYVFLGTLILSFSFSFSFLHALNNKTAYEQLNLKDAQATTKTTSKRQMTIARNAKGSSNATQTRTNLFYVPFSA